MTTTGIVIDDFCVGDAISIDHTITGLPSTISSASIGFKVWEGDTTIIGSLITVTTTPSAYGQIINPGTLDVPTQTYTAEVVFVFSGTNTVAMFTPGKPTYFFIQVAPGPYTSEVSVIKPKISGRDG